MHRLGFQSDAGRTSPPAAINPRPPRPMSHPALDSLAADNLAALTLAETDAEITATLLAAGIDLDADAVANEVSSADALADHLDGFGIRGVEADADGRVIESPTWTAEEIRRRHAFHVAGIPADDVRACFDSPAAASTFSKPSLPSTLPRKPPCAL